MKNMILPEVEGYPLAPEYEHAASSFEDPIHEAIKKGYFPANEDSVEAAVAKAVAFLNNLKLNTKK